MYQFFYSDSTTKEKDSICVLIIFLLFRWNWRATFHLSSRLFLSYFDFVIIRFGIKYQKHLIKKHRLSENQEKPCVAEKISRIKLRY